MTGHSSDVVDLYQITSDTQRETIIKVMREKPIENVDENCKESCCEQPNIEAKAIPIVSTVSVSGQVGCCCRKTYTSESNNIGELLDSIINSNSGNKKIIFKIEVQIEEK